MGSDGHSPVLFSSVFACVVGVLGIVASGVYSWPALGIGLFGGILLLGGVFRGSRFVITFASGCIFIAAIVAGYHGAHVGAVLVSVTAAVLAWDAGRTAISIGMQLGRNANTVRIEGVHLVASTGVGLLTVGIGYLSFEIATGGQPLSALLLLIIAAVVFLTAIQISSGEAN